MLGETRDHPAGPAAGRPWRLVLGMCVFLSSGSLTKSLLTRICHLSVLVVLVFISNLVSWAYLFSLLLLLLLLFCLILTRGYVYWCPGTEPTS